jgi:hypothetical protein
MCLKNYVFILLFSVLGGPIDGISHYIASAPISKLLLPVVYGLPLL